MWMNVFLVFIGGGIGSVSRYLLSSQVYKYSEGTFPTGTLAVNLIGCAMIGFLWALSERMSLSPDFRMFFFIGILGGFTTFSTFGLETFHILRDGEFRMALINILASNVLGIGLVFAGFMLGRIFFK
jgi:fluoride exporter